MDNVFQIVLHNIMQIQILIHAKHAILLVLHVQEQLPINVFYLIIIKIK